MQLDILSVLITLTIRRQTSGGQEFNKNRTGEKALKGVPTAKIQN